ncbi:MAG: hypothetical protein IT580_18125 [Verrucomicrobiales bacterium]|nr:hypothetical protein [Verrucomicrobiales bacterium]
MLAMVFLVVGSVLPLATLGAAEPDPIAAPPALKTFDLLDQFGTNHHVAFPRSRPLLLLVGDRQGVKEVDTWIEPLKSRWATNTDILGIADVRAVPRFLRNRVTTGIRGGRPQPVMLDFEGIVIEALGCERRVANLFVTHPDGRVVATVTGPPTESNLKRVHAALTPLLLPPTPAREAVGPVR